MAPNVRMYSATHESVTVGRDMKNTDRVKSQSDCSIRYRALLEKKPSFPEGCRIRRQKVWRADSNSHFMI